jgi:hypothetical protein
MRYVIGLCLSILFLSGTVFSQTQTLTIDLPSVHSISMGMDADVTLIQSDRQAAEIKGPKEVLDLLNKDVHNGNWAIGANKKKGKMKGDIKITVYMSEIKDIAIGSSGSIRSKGKFKDLKEVNLALSGSADLNLELDARKINCALSGSGDIGLEGSSDELNISIAGSGDVSCGKLKAEVVNVNVAGSGDVKVYADQKLNVNIVGSGDVYYKGNAEVEKSVLGSGEVHAK